MNAQVEKVERRGEHCCLELKEEKEKISGLEQDMNKMKGGLVIIKILVAVMITLLVPCVFGFYTVASDQAVMANELSHISENIKGIKKDLKDIDGYVPKKRGCSHD